MNGSSSEVAAAVPLFEATDAATFGAKAANLGHALGHGLAVPPGVALSWALVEGAAHGDARCVRSVVEAWSSLGAPVAVRSSAVGEDSVQASFAGQHSSRLNVTEPEGVVEAVRAVWRSGHGPAAAGYRRRLGLPPDVRIAVVVQRLVDSAVSGVLFDSHPLSGQSELLIEAAWGLGEAVAGGVVVPDLFRVAPTGEVLERRAGTKEVEIRPAPGGGTTVRQVPPERSRSLCLDDGQLGGLHELALGHWRANVVVKERGREQAVRVSLPLRVE